MHRRNPIIGEPECGNERKSSKLRVVLDVQRANNSGDVGRPEVWLVHVFSRTLFLVTLRDTRRVPGPGTCQLRPRIDEWSSIYFCRTQPRVPRICFCPMTTLCSNVDFLGFLGGDDRSVCRQSSTVSQCCRVQPPISRLFWCFRRAISRRLEPSGATRSHQEPLG